MNSSLALRVSNEKSPATTIKSTPRQHPVFHVILSKPDASAYRLIEEIECHWASAPGLIVKSDAYFFNGPGTCSE